MPELGPLINQLEWRAWVTPQLLRKQPIHRWFVFPHSFTSELVNHLIDDWQLDSTDTVLDPFVGAGTTLLASKSLGIPAIGCDISPLSTFASNVKVGVYDCIELRTIADSIDDQIGNKRQATLSKFYPDLVMKALPDNTLLEFDAASRIIDDIQGSPTVKRFFRLALIASIPEFSKAVATGGWLKWVEPSNVASDFQTHFRSRILDMLSDLSAVTVPDNDENSWSAIVADARRLPLHNESISAVITSPPYPNRHDYTRVFGVELMFGFLDWKGTRSVRYQSFESHPEARPVRPESSGYHQPTILQDALAEIKVRGVDPRIPKMLEGYVTDLFLTLKEIRRVCKPGSRIALVLGNAQYAGVAIPVDEITADVAVQVGLECSNVTTVRYRGNSAQQMGTFGRIPSRESIIHIVKPVCEPRPTSRKAPGI